MIAYDALFRSSLAGRSAEIGLVGDDPDEGHGAGLKAFCEDVGLEWLNDVTRRWTLPLTIDDRSRDEVVLDGRHASVGELLRAISPLQPLVAVRQPEVMSGQEEQDLLPGQIKVRSRLGGGNYEDDYSGARGSETTMDQGEADAEADQI